MPGCPAGSHEVGRQKCAGSILNIQSFASKFSCSFVFEPFLIFDFFFFFEFTILLLFAGADSWHFPRWWWLLLGFSEVCPPLASLSFSRVLFDQRPFNDVVDARAAFLFDTFITDAHRRWTGASYRWCSRPVFPFFFIGSFILWKSWHNRASHSRVDVARLVTFIVIATDKLVDANHLTETTRVWCPPHQKSKTFHLFFIWLYVLNDSSSDIAVIG